MPNFDLKLCAELENIRQIDVDADMEWILELKCLQCRENHRGEVGVNAQDEHELPTGRGTANLVMKCKNCSSAISLSFKGPFKSYVNIEDESPRPQTLATVECRGAEVFGWASRTGFTCTGLTGFKFEDLDLSDDFADYDESTNVPVGITEIKTSSVKAK